MPVRPKLVNLVVSGDLSYYPLLDADFLEISGDVANGNVVAGDDRCRFIYVFHTDAPLDVVEEFVVAFFVDKRADGKRCQRIAYGKKIELNRGKRVIYNHYSEIFDINVNRV